MSESVYDRPQPQTERALFSLVQEHLREYSADGSSNTGEHSTSDRFRVLERGILERWSDQVRSSIFREDKDEL